MYTSIHKPLKFSKLLRRFISDFPGKRLKHFFLISNVAVGNILPAIYGLSGAVLEYASTIGGQFCLEIHYT
jgi:hypothetical protein